MAYPGPVYEHRLMMEHCGANRGYGYVRFTMAEVSSGAGVVILEMGRMQSKRTLCRTLRKPSSG